MDLTYRLTREDHRLFTRLAGARVKQHAKLASGWLLRPVVLTLAAVLLGAFLLFYLLSTRRITDFAYLVALLAYAWGAMCMWLCLWSSQRWLNRHWLPDNSRFLSEVRLKVTGDGVEVSGPMATSKYSWQAFSEITQSGDLILLWLDRAQALLVSGQAFANDEMRRTFLETVRGHLPSAST